MNPGQGLGGLLVLLVSCGCPCAPAVTPVLYSQPAYQSPVRGDPDDLLLLPGYGLGAGDTVVYEAISDTTQAPVQPCCIPSSSTESQGIADLVSSADAPSSLVVRLPEAMKAGQSYALWVADSSGNWSAPVLINDARPLWITPDGAFRSAQLAGLPRVLKIVGHNLQAGPTPAAGTQVRLVGQSTGATYVLAASNTDTDPLNTTDALQRHVAAVNLPSTLTPDEYAVQVSRDGTSWVGLLGNGQSPPQLFAVAPDPATPPIFSVSDPKFADPSTGPCQPDDGIDDTACILLAMRAATAAGGGTVLFGAGTWTMSNPGMWASGSPYSDRAGISIGHCSAPTETCGVSYFGVLVPVGVNLQGAGYAGTNATIIERTPQWLTNSGTALTGFTLQGNNTVSGIAFVDDTQYTPGVAGQPALQLGLPWYFAHLYGAADPTHVSNITITSNLFAKPFRAIGTGSLPTDHIYITSNVFGGAYDTAIALGQDGNDVRNLQTTPTPVYPYEPYRFSDSIIDYNVFYPSSLQQTAATYNGGGSVATQINTGLRLDFSSNTADGTSKEFLYDPVNDSPGWRAAHFWSTGVNQEMLLVSNNIVTCPGDKYGDGEAIVFDGSSDAGGMPAAQPVVSAVAWTNSQEIPGTSVTVQGTVSTSLPTATTPVDISAAPGAYYRGYWLQVVQGAGKGQWRKVESVSTGSNSNGATLTVTVTPAFDVLPDTSSEVVLTHAYWQTVTVNNFVDQRTPICTKANTRHGGTGGYISWYASTADSVIEGNQQYDTSGLTVNHSYEPAQSAAVAGTVLQSSNAIRGNLISGNYHWMNPAGALGGIQLGYGATAYYCGGNTCPAPAPPVLGFGIAIAHNTITQGDATDADGSTHPPIGAIGSNPNWNTGPVDSAGLDRWQMGDATLVFHNSLQNVSDSVSGSTPNVPHVGIGMDVAQGTTLHPAISWRSTLYGNTCNAVDLPLSDFGLGTVRYCPAGSDATCECRSISSVDVGVTADSSDKAPAAGGVVIFAVTVINHDESNSATAATLFIEPSAGVQIQSLSPSTGTCDASINVCTLGILPAGQSATVSVTASLMSSGAWPVTFSVTHSDADPVPQNDSTQFIEQVRSDVLAP